MFSAVRHVARARAAFPSRLTRVPASFRTVVTKKYTPEHESVAFDDETGLGTIAITEHAQESLGDVVFVELPKVGSTFAKGDSVGSVESVKAASDIYAPVSGEIVEINEKLNDKPGLVNRSPDDEGWLCKIRLSEPKEFDDLLTQEEYKKSLDP